MSSCLLQIFCWMWFFFRIWNTIRMAMKMDSKTITKEAPKEIEKATIYD